MKKRIDLILNAKGGVGKSFFAINLVQYLKDQKVPHLAIDTDNANSTLKRTHPEALFANLNQRRGLDAVFTGLDDQEDDQVDVTAYAVWQMPRIMNDSADNGAERREERMDDVSQAESLGLWGRGR